MSVTRTVKNTVPVTKMSVAVTTLPRSQPTTGRDMSNRPGLGNEASGDNIPQLIVRVGVLPCVGRQLLATRADFNTTLQHQFLGAVVKRRQLKGKFVKIFI
jgi:hypothetical protein